MLLYADDFILVSVGVMAGDGMRALLGQLDAFNGCSGMRANTGPGKTELVVYAASAVQRASLQAETFTVGGAVIMFVSQYRYLGVIYHETQYWKADLAVRRLRAQQATGGLHSCLASLDAGKDVGLAFRMHDVCVRTVETYASAVWATRYHAVGSARVVNNPMEQVHLQFMRRWCRLRQNVPVWMIYAELGRLPLHYYWWREILRFFNALVALPAGSVWRDMLSDSMAQRGRRRRNWCGDVAAFLAAVGLPDILSMQALDVPACLEALMHCYDSVWDGLAPYPRCAEDRPRLTTYYRWMYGGEWLLRPGYMASGLSYRRLYMFVRFKLGCHDLYIETGRWAGVPRAERICQRCHQGAFDDERHLVFECDFFEPRRRLSAHLFDRKVAFDMRRFFSHEDQRAVVSFILDCLGMIQTD